MSDLLPRVDHIAEGLARTISQYRGKPAFNILSAIYLNQVQLIEDAIHDAVDAWKVDSAVGWRLDVLGGLVGQVRISPDDEVFRIYVKARIRANRSSGRVDDLRGIADLLIPGHRYYELPQCCYFEIQESTLVYGTAVAVLQLLQYAAKASVRVQLLWTPVEDAFELAMTGADVVDASYGLCSTDGTLPAHAGELSAGL